MPTGFQSGQPGNIVPLSGEAEIRISRVNGGASAIDALTITGHSSMSTAADFLVLRSNDAEGATGSRAEKFVIGSSGQLSRFKYYMVVDTTASTAPTLGASQSGQVHGYGGFNDGVRVLLPAPEVGLVYTIIQTAANATGGVAVSATRGAGAQIRAPFRGSGLSTALVVGAPTSLAGHAAVFIAVSTLVWQMFPAINGIEGSSVDTEISGCWTSVAA